VIFVKYRKVSSYTIRNMAPRMGLYQHALIKDLLRLRATQAEYASTAGYIARLITTIRRNLRIFRLTRAPLNSKGGQFLLSNRIIVVILMRLEEKPTLFSDKLQWLIYDVFGVVVSRYIIFRELYLTGWIRKQVS
jgi:hypothetical protein